MTRAFITLFMSGLCAFLAWALFKEFTLHTGPEAHKYLLGGILASVAGLSWLIFYEIAVLVTGFAMGLFGIYMSALYFSWQSLFDLIVGGILIAIFLAYGNHYKKTRNKELSEASWIAVVTIYPAIGIYEESEAIAFFVGGVTALALASAGIMIKWKPNQGWKFGPIRYNPSETNERP